MGNIGECYLDDILAKYKTKDTHIEVLAKIFDRLIKHNVRFIPKKCVFSVTSGKLLGYIFSRRGIEVDFAKIKAITKILPPHNLKEIRILSCKINVICRFITQLSDKCKPFNHLLKKRVKFEWIKKFQ